jgi:hypothetical protein
MGKAGKREYVQVLRLMEAFRTEEVTAAVGDAIARGTSGRAIRGMHRRLHRSQVIVPTISASVGNRPSAFLEQAVRPSTRISKMPPPDRFRVTSASGLTLRMRFAASRARGS